jgi:hypothetical protein
MKSIGSLSSKSLPRKRPCFTIGVVGRSRCGSTGGTETQYFVLYFLRGSSQDAVPPGYFAPPRPGRPRVRLPTGRERRWSRALLPARPVRSPQTIHFLGGRRRRSWRPHLAATGRSGSPLNRRRPVAPLGHLTVPFATSAHPTCLPIFFPPSLSPRPSRSAATRRTELATPTANR